MNDVSKNRMRLLSQNILSSDNIDREVDVAGKELFFADGRMKFYKDQTATWEFKGFEPYNGIWKNDGGTVKVDEHIDGAGSEVFMWLTVVSSRLDDKEHFAFGIVLPEDIIADEEEQEARKYLWLYPCTLKDLEEPQ